VGGIYADTLAHFLGMDLPPTSNGTEFHGMLRLEGEDGGSIAPALFQFNGSSIISVPAKPE
jgi:hypothetical protein